MQVPGLPSRGRHRRAADVGLQDLGSGRLGRGAPARVAGLLQALHLLHASVADLRRLAHRCRHARAISGRVVAAAGLRGVQRGPHARRHRRAAADTGPHQRPHLLDGGAGACSPSPCPQLLRRAVRQLRVRDAGLRGVSLGAPGTLLLPPGGLPPRPQHPHPRQALPAP